MAGVALRDVGAPVLVELEGEFARAMRLVPVSTASRSW